MDNDVTYFSEMCELALQMMEMGALPEDIIKVWGIDEKKFQDWRDEYPEFDKAVKNGMGFSQAWWMNEIRENLNNPSYNFEHAREVMVKNFEWVD